MLRKLDDYFDTFVPRTSANGNQRITLFTNFIKQDLFELRLTSILQTKRFQNFKTLICLRRVRTIDNRAARCTFELALCSGYQSCRGGNAGVLHAVSVGLKLAFLFVC